MYPTGAQVASSLIRELALSSTGYLRGEIKSSRTQKLPPPNANRLSCTGHRIPITVAQYCYRVCNNSYPRVRLLASPYSYSDPIVVMAQMSHLSEKDINDPLGAALGCDVTRRSSHHAMIPSMVLPLCNGAHLHFEGGLASFSRDHETKGGERECFNTWLGEDSIERIIFYDVDGLVCETIEWRGYTVRMEYYSVSVNGPRGYRTPILQGRSRNLPLHCCAPNCRGVPKR
ncbi:hypothetical protein RRG08_016454 [Elysia crispata]|uniref:Uncharacterized protein n=1 Tax=Elysia crispata TaxID=231223 RepID=A0AAE1CV67_9GAST|nr:hypothetical protein RRG08_016454 [Elysia crispata]